MMANFSSAAMVENSPPKSTDTDIAIAVFISTIVFCLNEVSLYLLIKVVEREKELVVGDHFQNLEFPANWTLSFQKIIGYYRKEILYLFLGANSRRSEWNDSTATVFLRFEVLANEESSIKPLSSRKFHHPWLWRCHPWFLSVTLDFGGVTLGF